MKICSKCNLQKPLSEFRKKKRYLLGYTAMCKEWLNLCNKEYYAKNLEKIKKYRELNKEKATIYNIKYKKENKELLKIKSLEYLKRVPESSKIKKVEYRIANRERYNKYKKYRWDNDPLYKLTVILRGRICSSFKRTRGWNKNNTTANILGIDFNGAKIYIERQFKNGMTWENQGEWHIDHIIPLATANTHDELIKLCHYTNLQPLWGNDNLKKGTKIIEHQTKMAI